jgi:hypothetical protein
MARASWPPPRPQMSPAAAGAPHKIPTQLINFGVICSTGAKTPSMPSLSEAADASSSGNRKRLSRGEKKPWRCSSSTYDFCSMESSRNEACAWASPKLPEVNASVGYK